MKATFIKAVSGFVGAMGFSFAVLATGHTATIVPPVYSYTGALGGNTATYSWNGFVNPTYPLGISGTSGNWGSGGMPASIAPTNVVTTNIKFAPTPGFASDTTDFLTDASGGGLYTFFSAAHLGLVSTSPIANIKSLVFQIYLAEGFDNPSTFTGAADLLSGPTLSLTLEGGGTQNVSLLASYVNSSEAGNVSFPTTFELLSYQWDLSGVSSAITGYSVNWQTSYHSITYGMSVFESDAVKNSSVLAVPEPSSLALLGVGSLFALRLRKRRSAGNAR